MHHTKKKLDDNNTCTSTTKEIKTENSKRWLCGAKKIKRGSTRLIGKTGFRDYTQCPSTAKKIVKPCYSTNGSSTKYHGKKNSGMHVDTAKKTGKKFFKHTGRPFVRENLGSGFLLPEKTVLGSPWLKSKFFWKKFQSCTKYKTGLKIGTESL